MNKAMELKKGIPVRFGLISGVVFGGPFRNYVPGTRRLVGVKMAQEIEHPHDFKVDTRDFSVPSQAAMQAGIMFAISNLYKGYDVYAGCMGGIGRTGLFMACMAKVQHDYFASVGEAPPRPVPPVAYVRAHYIPHAVETDEQQDFVADFDTGPAVRALGTMNKALSGQVEVRTVESVVVNEVERVVYLGPVSWLIHSARKMFKK